ncbi:MAG: ATP synthase F0 subunit B [Acholeplasmataceae bacterium]|nr:MAG: ATP synthase F0 subunit B [Acholeplasmataceae bacterium]
MREIFQEVTSLIEEGLYSVFNRPDIVILNLLSLLVLFIIVRKFLWTKVTTYLELRQEALTEALAAADAERERAQELQEKSVREYERMKEETRELKDKLMQEAYQQQEALVTSAKAEAKRRIEQAEKDIAFEIEQANEAVKASIKDVAFAAARKIVKREIDESMHEEIIDKITNERTKKT